MFANNRTLSEMSRKRFENSSRTKMKAAIPPVTPEGMSPLR